MRNWPAVEFKRTFFYLLLIGVLYLVIPETVSASDGHTEFAFLASVSISILAATVFAYFFNLLKQPLILAYIAAGVAIGPEIGFAWVQNKNDIQTMAEIGLILLLFMIGLELDLRKLKESGKSLIIAGVFQFILCVLMGLGFFFLLGFTLGGKAPFTYEILGVQVLGGPYDLLYLAACISLSSTAIVVKLLYEKFELDTLAGRFTLGILIFQDLWAIILLSLQPNLAHPNAVVILLSFAKAALLVLVSLLISKYFLGFIFRGIAKLPEIMLLASLGWCFLIAGLAAYLKLSMEMGALIAGVALSTFPYNLDIIGKIINIRDFFIVLFFVALGMVIPNPLDKPGLLLIAGLTAGFLVLTRFFSIYPLLYGLGNGNRVSLLATINLSQISEFALVIAVIGARPEKNHIGPDIVTIIIFIFVLTSIASTYMIKYNQSLANVLRKVVVMLGFRSLQETQEDRHALHPEIALLGFYRVASSFVTEMENLKPHLKEKLVVVDFNPEVFKGLRARGVKVVYGDISNMQTLHHAGIEEAKVVISTITDDILVGTSNLKLINQIRHLCPQAQIVVTAGNPSRALKLYEAGADYVLLPNFLTANHLLEVLDRLMREEVTDLAQEEIDRLSQELEVLA
jgi:Kef-type K+ transport system membrane component KefB/Trk K+ transport system NAD-binding subunit